MSEQMTESINIIRNKFNCYFLIRGIVMMGGFGGFNGYQTLGGYGMMGSFGWFGICVMILIGILVIIGIVFLIRSLVNHSNRVNFSSSDRSIEILKERLAKGEITKEEYETIKKSL